MLTSLLLALALAAAPAAVRPLPLDSVPFILDTTTGGVDTTWGLRTATSGHSAATSATGASLVFTRAPGHNRDTASVVRVDRLGLPDSASVAIPGATVITQRSVAAIDTGWVVIWMNQNVIKAFRIGAHGQVLDLVPLTVGVNAREPSMVASDSFYLVAWVGNTPPPDLYSARVRPDGSVSAAVFIPTGASRWHRRIGPTVAAGEGTFLLAFGVEGVGDTAVYCTLLDGLGQAIDTIPLIVSGEGDGGSVPTASFDGVNYLVVWRRGSDSRAAVVGRRVSPAGVILDPEPFVISAAPSFQTTPFACRHRDGVLVAWQDSRHGDAELYAARVSPAGEVLDPDGIRLTDNPSTQRLPCISAYDSTAIVAWQDNRQTPDSFRIRWRTLGPDAAPAGPDTTLPRYVRVTTRYSHHQNPAIGYGDSTYLVTWEDTRYGAGRTAVRGVVVGHGPGYPVSPSFALSSGTGSARKPAVAFCESLFLVAWQDSGSTPKTTIRGTRVRPDGSVLDSVPLLLGISGAYNSTDPKLTTTDGHWYLVWSAYGTRVTPVGLDGRPASSLGYRVDGGGAIAAGSTNCALAWTNNVGTWAARTTPEGVLIDSASIHLSDNFDRFTNPSVAWDGENYAVGWQSSDPYDLRLRLLTAAGQPTESLRITPLNRPLSPTVLSADDGWLVFHATQVSGAKRLYLTKCSPDLRTYVTIQFDSVRGPGIPRPVLGPESGGFVVFACTTTTINGNPVMAERVFGRPFVDTLIPPLPPPDPPLLLFPPHQYTWVSGPCWLLADSAYPDADSFSFIVFRHLRTDTLWKLRTTAPCCTIPDELLTRNDYNRWQAAVHVPGLPWSAYTTDRIFYVSYQPAGVTAEQPAHHGPSLMLDPQRNAGLVTGRLNGIEPGLPCRLDLLDAAGRRAATARLEGSGPFRLGRKDGRRLGAGVYYLRVTGPSWTLTRKLVLF
jgi:hypothetical protein